MNEEIAKSIVKLKQNDLPEIVDISQLSEYTGVECATILNMIYSQENFYREFKLKKRSGGYRTISVPYPSLLSIQRWIYSSILEKFNCSESAHGFIKSKSILSNAEVHLGNTIILKTDIKNFFPSIKLRRVYGIFKKLGYTKKISYFLCNLCTYRNALPQGAATSPAISNIIAFRLDNRLKVFADSFQLEYSRYSDDLTFSGKYIHFNLIDMISNILMQEGFRINKKKTKLITGNGKK